MLGEKFVLTPAMSHANAVYFRNTSQDRQPGAVPGVTSSPGGPPPQPRYQPQGQPQALHYQDGVPVAPPPGGGAAAATQPSDGGSVAAQPPRSKVCAAVHRG